MKKDNIIINTENKDSYENRVIKFDKRFSTLLSKGLISSDFYFSSRAYYAKKIYDD
jgi:hypothetical protein